MKMKQAALQKVSNMMQRALQVTADDEDEQNVMDTYYGLRSGVRGRNFASYRQATDAVTKIGGSLFWGSTLASLFIGGIFALLFIGSNDVSNVLDISTRADLHLFLGI